MKPDGSTRTLEDIPQTKMRVRITLDEQITSVNTLISAARASMGRGGATEAEISAVLAGAIRSVDTLRWLQANREKIIGAYTDSPHI